MRKKKSRKQKNEELKRRYDAIKNLMSTFAMTTVAVVAAVTLIPASPKAEIIKTVALSEEITYQVTVTDEDNSLDLDTLTVVLENQLEYYEQPIELGETTGFFEELRTNTEYRLSVYGNKGFGAERLDTTMVTTREKVGATILSVTSTSDFHNDIYTVDVSIYDPDNKYTSIELHYGYRFEPDTDLNYSIIPVTSNRQAIELFDVFTSYPFHITIEGTSIEGTELLDEIWVTPPFKLSSDIYVAYLNNNEVAFHAYGNTVVPDLQYQMNVYLNDNLLKTEHFTPSSDYHSNNKWLIKDLLPDQTYLFECIAIYSNPQTLRTEEKIVFSEEISTTKQYTYTLDIEPYDTYLEVSIILLDPDDVLSNVYFEVVDTTGEFDAFINGESYLFERNGEEKVYTFTIEIPNIQAYEITIGMRSITNSQVHQIIKEINEE